MNSATKLCFEHHPEKQTHASVKNSGLLKDAIGLHNRKVTGYQNILCIELDLNEMHSRTNLFYF